MEFGQESALSVEQYERRSEYEHRWEEGGTNFLSAYNDIGIDFDANKTASDFVKSKIHEVVKDVEMAKLLSPDNAIGRNRVCYRI